MKKIILFWSVLLLLAMTMLSCNKSRFDFSELDSVEGSGEWKLPIASLNVTLSRVMNQLSSNDFIETDPNGNIRIKYDFEQDPIITMADLLRFQNTEVPFEFSFDNPHQDEVGVHIDTTILFSHRVELGADSAHVEALKLRSGTLKFKIQTNLGEIDSIIVTSPNISFPGGDTLNAFIDVLGDAELDLTGALVSLSDYCLDFHFRIHYWMSGIEAETYDVHTDVGLLNMDIEYLSGYLDAYEFPIEFDTIFDIPLNITGELDLKNANLQILEKNTCEHLDAIATIDTLMFYGGNNPPTMILQDEDIVISSGQPGFVEAFNESIDLMFSTSQTGLRLAGNAVANPLGLENLITISDTSCLGLKVHAEWPFKFKVDNVYYYDTIDMKMDQFTATELIHTVRLIIGFESRLPFSIGAQVFAYNSETGKMTEVMNNNSLLAGCYGNNAQKTETVVTITHEKLRDFLDSDKILLKLSLDTDGHVVQLNLNSALDMVIKAEAEYAGEVDL